MEHWTQSLVVGRRGGVVGGAVSAALTGVADGEVDGLGSRPAMVSLDLHADLHGSGREQVAVPASGDPVTVDAKVPVQRGGRDLRPAAVNAGA